MLLKTVDRGWDHLKSEWRQKRGQTQSPGVPNVRIREGRRTSKGSTDIGKEPNQESTNRAF